jgi:trans-aconitate methyltransferase
MKVSDGKKPPLQLVKTSKWGRFTKGAVEFKSEIKRRSIMIKDEWKAGLYENKHSFVSEYGKDVVSSLLRPQKNELILDIGCGTGDLANQIADSGAKVCGIDTSESMLEQAKRKYPDIQFRVADASNFTFKETFDAVFSNATLHWVKEPQNALICIWNALIPGGRFITEFGGMGNVQAIVKAIIESIGEFGLSFDPANCPWYFPSIAQYTTLMEEVGFRVTYAAHFDRLTPLEDGENGMRNWISMFAGSFS